MAYTVIYSTAGSAEEAEKIAGGLVEARLAACVQMLPISSVYRWQGAIERAQEILLLIKTRKELVDRVIVWIKDNHSYEVPEAIAVDIEGGLESYLEWIRDSTVE